MPVLPVPMIIALLLLGFLLHRAMTKRTSLVLLTLIGCCAVQLALMALVQYYELTWLRPLHPVLAPVIPMLAWLAFRQASSGALSAQELLVHALGPLLGLLCLLAYPPALDVLIPITFAGYGAAMGFALSVGEDSLRHSRLEHSGVSVLVWRVLAVALVASAATDVFIAIRMAAGDRQVLQWITSVFSSLNLLVLGALSLFDAAESDRDTPEKIEPDQTKNTEIINKLDRYVAQHHPYLDPDLTLARLARKVQVPEKQLSAAINAHKGENVSRYVNRHRVTHASALMLNGTSVTEAMLTSGFNTKSNFNREFLRVQGASPTAWLRSQTEAKQ